MPEADVALVEKWVMARDADAFAEIVSRHSAMVYGTCKRILGDATAAEDVTQECFVQLALIKRTVRPSVGGWLYTVAIRRSLDLAKSENRRKRREFHFAARAPKDNQVERDDVGRHVDDAIAALPKKLRDVIVYRFLEGQSHEAVAEQLGVARSTVQYRLTKALGAIRVFLKRRGIELTGSVVASMMTSELAEAAPAKLTAALGKIVLAATATPVRAGIGTSIAEVPRFWEENSS